MKKKSIFSSIKFKVFFSVTIIVALTIMVCVVLNSALAEKYYLERIKRTLAGSFSKICSLYDGKSITEKESTEIEKICNNSNMHVMIFSGRDIIYSSLPKDSARYSNNSSERENKPERQEQTIPRNMRPPVREFGKTSENGNSRFVSVLKETDSYKIISVYIAPLDTYNIQLTGNYKNQRIVIQSSAAAISENVSVANSFLIVLGLFALIIAALFAYIISKRITDPIYSLSVIAKSMSEMDFSKKYKGEQKDEIGLLGESINILSDKLEKAIADLKNANLKLTRDIDKKEKIDRQRKEFLSNVSHELKTPIAIIEAYADGLCEMEQKPEERKVYAEVILDEAQKMNTLIKKLTSLMRLEADSGAADLEKYDIHSQLKNIVEKKSIIIGQGNADITLDAEGECLVWADSFLIEEAVVNYLVNAAKYGTGKIKVYTECFKNSKEKDVVRICVFNTGKPVSEEESELIWTSFYMSDKARTRSEGSSGLGLSIVKAIADAHKMECGSFNTEDGVIFYIDIESAV